MERSKRNKDQNGNNSLKRVFLKKNCGSMRKGCTAQIIQVASFPVKTFDNCHQENKTKKANKRKEEIKYSIILFFSK